MSQDNNWYVITGGPSTGKSTLLTELGKLGHKTIPEAARTLIDESIAKGISVEELRSNEKRFQDDVARLKAKIESEHDKNLLTFFDRGMQDSIAYMKPYGFAVESWITELMDVARYKKVFLLEPLPVFSDDYARTEDQNFTKKLHGFLHDAYTEYGMEPVLIPAVSVEERLKMVLDKVNSEQNI